MKPQQNVLMTIVAHRKLLEIAPEHAAGYYHSGIALQARGRSNEAVESLQIARTLFAEQEDEEGIRVVTELLQDLQPSLFVIKIRNTFTQATKNDSTAYTQL